MVNVAPVRGYTAIAPSPLSERIAEVEDFVDFLQSRDESRGLTRSAMKSSEATFAKVWDNEDDAAYDKL